MKRFLALLLCMMLLIGTASAATLQLPGSLQRIEAEAFMGDTSLADVIIPQGTTTIGARAFKNSSVARVTVPASVTSIAADAFDGCRTVTLVVVRNSYAHTWCVEKGVRYQIAESTATAVYNVSRVLVTQDASGANMLTAYVTAANACTLKIEVLNDAGTQVLSTATAQVTAGLNNAPVSIAPAAALPTYFVLRAVLVNGSAQLCDPCTNHHYTSAYDAFNQQSPSDFPQASVISYGASGYAVMADTVKKLNASATVSGGKYTFRTAQSLKKGDTVQLMVNGSSEIIKIASVTNNGDGTVTVTPNSNIALGDMYDVVNISGNLVSGGSRSKDSTSVFNLTNSVSVGNMELSYNASMTIDVNLRYDKEKWGEDYFEFEMLADTDGHVDVFLGGEVDTWKENNAPAIQLYNSVVILPGISAPAFLNVSIPLNIHSKMGGNVSFGFENHYGFYYNPTDGWTSVEEGDSNAEARVDGYIRLMTGPEVSLTLSLLGVLEARVGGQFGPELTGEVQVPSVGGSTAAAENSKHACTGCLDMDIYATANLRGTLVYNITDNLSGTLLDVSIDAYHNRLGGAFYSFDNESISVHGGQKVFALGACPNRKYRTTVRTLGMQGTEVTGIASTITGAKTNTVSGSSPLSTYLYPGSYTAKANFSTGAVTLNFTVTNSAHGVILEEKETVIEGYVRDNDTGNAISGATVTLTLPNGATRTQTTGSTGAYHFEDLPGGSYTVAAAAPGYKNYTYPARNFGAGTTNQVNFSLVAEALDYEAVIQRILDTMGPDLVKRLKADGIDLSISFNYYTPSSGNGDGVLVYSIELRSPVSSTYPTYTVNDTLFAQGQEAIIDANTFGLSQEDMATLKAHLYSRWNHYADIDLAGSINMHVNQTPSYEAIVYLRDTRRASSFPNYSRAWYLNWYDWGERIYTNKP